MSGPDPFEARLRRELHQAADEIEPQRSLADLRRRITIWRLFHRRPRRLRQAARSVPEPETDIMPSLAERVWRSSLPRAGLGFCWCGRPTPALYCCWRCQAAHDGGWILAPWNPQDVWTDVHTWGCQRRFSQRDPRAEYLTAAWNAGSARPLRWKDHRHDPPLPPAALPARGARSPADVRYSLAGSPGPAPASRDGSLRPRARARHARAHGRPDRRDPGRQRPTTLLQPPEKGTT